MHASTRRKSSIHHTECFIQPHGRQNVEQTPCDTPQKRTSRYTVCAPLRPSHYPHKCTRQAQNGSSTWRQPRKNCGSAPHKLLKQSGVLDLFCLGQHPKEDVALSMALGRIGRNSKHNVHKTGEQQVYTSHPAQHKPNTHLTDTRNASECH